MLIHIEKWIRMGGYGVYIWSAYSLGLLTLSAHYIALKLQKYKIKQQLLRWYKPD